MVGIPKSRISFSCGLLARAVSTLAATPTQAQQAQPHYEILPPEAQMTDSNGVDMTSGLVTFSDQDVRIGGPSALANVVQSLNYAVSPPTTSPGTAGANGFYKNLGGAGQVPQFITNFMGGLNVSTGSLAPDGTNAYAHTPVLVNGAYVYWNTVNFSFDGSSETFLTYTQTSMPWSETAPVGYSFTSVSKRGGALIYLGGNEYKYVAKDGTQYFANNSNQIYTSFPMATWVVYRAVQPTGLTTKYNYSSGRLVSVERSDGFSIHYLLDANGRMTGARALNDAVVRCGSLDTNCAPVGTWPSSSYAWAPDGSSFTVSDAAGQSDVFYLDTYGRVIRRKEKTASGAYNWEFTYCRRESPFDCVWSVGGVSTYYPDFTKQVIKDGLAYNYVLSPDGDSGRFWFYSRTDQFGNHLHKTFSYKGSGSSGVINEVILPDTTVVDLLGDVTNRVTRVTQGTWNITYAYDDRGNVTQKTLSDGDTTHDQVSAASFDAACANYVTCNHPNWVKDPKGNITDLTYSPVHGQVLTETSPANASGIRVQRRFEYVQRYAWIRNLANTGYEQSVQPVWVLSKMRFCATSATVNNACAAGPADEVVTEYDYGPDTGPNNLLVRGMTVTATNAAGQTETQRTCMSYDTYANEISRTSPNASLTACP